MRKILGFLLVVLLISPFVHLQNTETVWDGDEFRVEDELKHQGMKHYRTQISEGNQISVTITPIKTEDTDRDMYSCVIWSMWSPYDKINADVDTKYCVKLNDYQAKIINIKNMGSGEFYLSVFGYTIDNNNEDSNTISDKKSRYSLHISKRDVVAEEEMEEVSLPPPSDIDTRVWIFISCIVIGSSILICVVLVLLVLWLRKFYIDWKKGSNESEEDTTIERERNRTMEEEENKHERWQKRISRANNTKNEMDFEGAQGGGNLDDDGEEDFSGPLPYLNPRSARASKMQETDLWTTV